VAAEAKNRKRSEWEEMEEEVAKAKEAREKEIKRGRKVINEEIIKAMAL